MKIGFLKTKVVGNTVMLYLMTFAKLIFPLLTLPYLTRVLSEESYAVVSYVKSCMSYMQMIIDFGFILSSVKDIVKANEDKKEIGSIVGHTFLAKMFLSVTAGVVLLVMCVYIDILKLNILYTVCSFVGVVIASFLADFLFRGIEKMHFITITFVVMKGLSTIFTFIFVKNDAQILLIPILDIFSSIVAVVISFLIIRKLDIQIRIFSIKKALMMIKDSFSYFLSNIATTAFSALNTVLIGIYITDLTQVALWSLCLNIVAAIQGLYAPICNSVYPHMIKAKSLNFIKKVLLIFMPIVIVGCLICYVEADLVLGIIGGEKYVDGFVLFRYMIPILFFSFPAQVLGWPSLGAVGKVKETTTSTIIAAITQVLGIVLLLILGEFNIINLAILRCFTELVLLLVRGGMVVHYKKMFV
ncbi:MAG: oligosaccharide flippase family protein [Clostridia bacterium]|nr:oligosaccharide flippase family protein [Clostridia bacterium]